MSEHGPKSVNINDVIEWAEQAQGDNYMFFVNVPLFSNGNEKWEWVNLPKDSIINVLRARRNYLRIAGDAGNQVQIKVRDKSVFIGKEIY